MIVFQLMRIRRRDLAMLIPTRGLIECFRRLEESSGLKKIKELFFSLIPVSLILSTKKSSRKSTLI
jgi:hypothetical protein